MSIASTVARAGLVVVVSTIGVACGPSRAPVSTVSRGPSETTESQVIVNEPSSIDSRSPLAGQLVQHARPQSIETPILQLGHAGVEFGSRPPWRDAPKAEAVAPESNVTNEAGGPPLPARWRLAKTIWVGYGYLHHAEISTDGARVLTVSEQEGALRSYDANTGKLRHRVALPGFSEFDNVGFVTIDEPRGTVLVVRRPFTPRPDGATDVAPELVDLARGSFTPVESLPAGDGLRFAPRPRLLGISNRSTNPQSGTLSFWWVFPRVSSDGAPTLDAELSVRLDCKERPDDWALSRDGRLLAIAYYPSNTVDLLDLEQRRVRLRLPSPRWGGSVALSPDGALLALGGAELRVHDATSGEFLANDDKYRNNIDTIRFTPRADLLLTSAYDGKARSYVLPPSLGELRSLPRPQPLSHAGANVYALAMTPDGRRLVTSSGDQTLKVWAR